jgi:hypothetical protein
MIKDTASNAALSAAEFCKVQFERYLDSLGFTRKIRWIESASGDLNAPAYYLELDGHQYAVEVTTLADRVALANGSSPAVTPTRMADPLFGLLGEINSGNRVSMLQRLARKLHLERPMARLRRYRAKVKEALDALNLQLGEKREKLRDISLPKIVLVYDACRSLEQDMVEHSLNRVSSLSSFQMVFITNWDRESYVVYP